MSHRSSGRGRAPNPVGILLSVGRAVARGLDPHEAADAVERMTEARGGDPRQVWTVLYQVAAERLDLLQTPGCTCAPPAQQRPCRCLTCGGML